MQRQKYLTFKKYILFSINNLKKKQQTTTHLTPHSQFEALVLLAQPTNDSNRPDAQLLAELYRFLLYLLRQLPGGRQYDRVRTLVRVLHTGKNISNLVLKVWLKYNYKNFTLNNNLLS